jgi:hypothetical protein
MMLLMMICDRKVTQSVEFVDFALFCFTASGLDFRYWIVNGGLLLVHVAENYRQTQITQSTEFL